LGDLFSVISEWIIYSMAFCETLPSHDITMIFPFFLLVKSHEITILVGKKLEKLIGRAYRSKE
jgi:hypothetical protein